MRTGTRLISAFILLLLALAAPWWAFMLCGAALAFLAPWYVEWLVVAFLHDALFSSGNAQAFGMRAALTGSASLALLCLEFARSRLRRMRRPSYVLP